MKWVPVAVLVGLCACSETRDAGDRRAETGDRRPATGEGAPAAVACTAREFAAAVEVREASGAVWVPASFGLADHVVVVGDSGTKGAFAVIDAGTGALLGKGNLPLGEGVSDDIEGFARSGERYHALNSNGRVRTYRRSGAVAFELVGEPYPLHPELVCASPKKNNCGADFEGLCLAEARGEGCAGYAASRAHGALVCVAIGADGRLRADRTRRLAIAPPHALAGCGIAPEGDLLYAGSNGFGANAVVRVSGWRDPATARTESLGPAGNGFCEALAVGPGGAVYRFSDTGRSPTSLMSALSCPARSP